MRPEKKIGPAVARDRDRPVKTNNPAERSDEFKSRPAWTIDILVSSWEVAGPLAIEYDGAYWHAAPSKRQVDAAKSTDLLDAGYLVIRIRESPLKPLNIAHPRYLEVPVSPITPRPGCVMDQIRAWAATVPPSDADSINST